MRKVVGILLSLGAVSALALPVGASTFTLNGQTYTTQYNTGTGPDHALMVLEYGSTNYDFGYSFSGSPTGFDMLTAVAAASGGNMTIQDEFFQFDPLPAPAVPYIEAIDYLSNQPVYNYPDDPTSPGFSWFGYFNADGGGDWANLQLGAESRFLADGSADDWVYQDVSADADFNPVAMPTVAIAVPTPEPASLSVLGIGAVALLSRRRRKLNT